MSKTPFEIRADILALTKDYLDRQAHHNLDIWKRSIDISNSFYAQLEVPKMYTPEELIEATEKLYTFVTTKK